MYSFMGGGLFCAWVGTILLVVATATDHWMQYRLSGSFAHQGLWRYCLGNKCYLQTESIGKAPGRGPTSGRTMLRSTGFFRAIDCPYWAGAPGGPCRRPYCHFRHRGARGPGALVGGGAAPPTAGNARAGLGSPAQA